METVEKERKLEFSCEAWQAPTIPQKGLAAAFTEVSRHNLGLARRFTARQNDR